VALLAAACSGGGGGEAVEATTEASGTGAAAPSTTTTATTAPAPAVPCPEDRHAVVVDVLLLLASDGDLIAWIGDAARRPAPRPGAIELLQAYFQRNYEIVYLTGLPSDTLLGRSVPITEALPQWIAETGFPNGDATSLHMWDPAATSSGSVHKTQVMVDLATDGVTVDRVYTGGGVDVPTYRNGGVTGDNSIWAFDVDTDVEGAERIAGDDLVAHREATVDGLPDACTPGT
jgi:hypothetical protein